MLWSPLNAAMEGWSQVLPRGLLLRVLLLRGRSHSTVHFCVKQPVQKLEMKAGLGCHVLQQSLEAVDRAHLSWTTETRPLSCTVSGVTAVQSVRKSSLKLSLASSFRLLGLCRGFGGSVVGARFSLVSTCVLLHKASCHSLSLRGLILHSKDVKGMCDELEGLCPAWTSLSKKKACVPGTASTDGVQRGSCFPDLMVKFIRLLSKT